MSTKCPEARAFPDIQYDIQQSFTEAALPSSNKLCPASQRPRFSKFADYLVVLLLIYCTVFCISNLFVKTLASLWIRRRNRVLEQRSGCGGTGRSVTRRAKTETSQERSRRLWNEGRRIGTESQFGRSGSQLAWRRTTKTSTIGRFPIRFGPANAAQCIDQTEKLISRTK